MCYQIAQPNHEELILMIIEYSCWLHRLCTEYLCINIPNEITVYLHCCPYANWFTLLFIKALSALLSCNCAVFLLLLRWFPVNIIVQIMTGDNWSCLLIDTMQQFPFCTKDDPIHGSECGNNAFALFYFILFITLATHIFMNMFVASIIDTITFGLLKEKTIITPANLTEYQELWSDSEFDPLSKGFIGFHKLRSFVNRLGIPLGRRHNAPSEWSLSFYLSL